MKHLIKCLLIIFVTSCNSQNVGKVDAIPPTIAIGELNAQKIDNLELLGRVWGFLKYHHPAITKGSFDWDLELLKFLPNYLEAKSPSEINTKLLDWINSFGEIEACTSCRAVDEDAYIKPNFTWIEKQDKPLKEKLYKIFNNRSQEKNHYVSSANVGNPNFTNEMKYEHMPYPSEGIRLVSVYRYWNMIQYFFPNKHLMDKDWENILMTYIPIFLSATDELEYEQAVIQLIGEIQDSHANLYLGDQKIQEWKGNLYPTFQVKFIEKKLVVTYHFSSEKSLVSGLKIGDVITKIGGKSVEEIIQQRKKYFPGSNVSSVLRGISKDILRSNSSELSIEFISDSAPAETKIIELYPKKTINPFYGQIGPSNMPFSMLENNIGYITLQNIKATDISEIETKFIDCDAIIIDIRNYPSNFVVFSLGSFFVSEVTPFVKFTLPSFDLPGEFKFTEALEITNKDTTYTGKVVILVNELTQSQAEYTAMAFKAGKNATVIGSTTAGADGNVSEIWLPGGLSTLISGIGVFYPDGKETQRVGIIPDIFIEPTVQGIRERRDEVLEAAIKFIQGK